MIVYLLKFNVKKVIGSIVVLSILLICMFCISINDKSIRIFDFFEEPVVYNFDNIRTNEDRVGFLRQFGWKVDEKPIEVLKVQIPEEFEIVYEDYNELQKEIGLDLTEYKGKLVDKYAYKVFNHPTEKRSPVIANILIYEDKVIAADITTTSLDKFIHSLMYYED
ncbi:DUF4830 domain-containing protein [Petroclostridium sp. X23]|uniref:DUF4830 domain-containing protein n=1 Tax=Petroclostridium sp. X23 TaxID=3045146 RepID=UPI0024ACED8D|nr:DUF4830 domain-containing protein [Petroclostridium sp. X23]WHH61099.1 DUF4830 domain-containing protein [Petroclostridium sp. X23]